MAAGGRAARCAGESGGSDVVVVAGHVLCDLLICDSSSAEGEDQRNVVNADRLGGQG